MEGQVIELQMGPAKAMSLLKLGNPREESGLVIAGTHKGGNYLHLVNGYGGPDYVIRRNKRMKNFGIRLHSTGVPDKVDFEENIVVEFKTYSSRLDIPYHVQRGIFQCCFYCWMLGFGKFKRFRILLYNIDTAEIDIIIERNVDQFKFFKKLRRAIRLGILEIKNGKTVVRKKQKPTYAFYWIIRNFDQISQCQEIGTKQGASWNNSCLDSETYYWLMKCLENSASS